MENLRVESKVTSDNPEYAPPLQHLPKNKQIKKSNQRWTPGPTNGPPVLTGVILEHQCLAHSNQQNKKGASNRELVNQARSHIPCLLPEIT